MKITCPICNKEFKQITNSHVKTHGLTTTEFVEKYNLPLTTTLTRSKQSKNACTYVSPEGRERIKQQKMTGKTVECMQCKQPFYCITYRLIHKTKFFCSSSCSATYNNTHKVSGYRRSKLEKWLEEQLTNLYPNLEIHFNQKTTINSELDIYIPSLKLAFELNGIFHYEPIYSAKQLAQTQNNDKRKFQACSEHGIELCIIDTSKQKYFKEATSQQFLNIITTLINSKMEHTTGLEPATVTLEA